MQLMQGTRWGAMVVIKTENKTRKEGTGAVVESYLDELITVRCACKNEITLWASDLPKARWALPQDCGCGAGAGVPAGESTRIQPVGRPRGRQRESVTITLGHATIEKINAICLEEQQSFSRALEDVLELGLKQRELEQLAKS